MTHQTPPRHIFRADAIRRYLHERDRVALPRLLAPPTFLCLWILVGLLMIAMVGAWLVEVPVYATGQAVVTAKQHDYVDGDGEAIVVVFLPPDQLSHVQIGQSIRLSAGTGGETIGAAVIRVEPAILSPAAARRQFMLDGGAALAITQPAAVVTARLPETSTEYIGSVFSAAIEVGSRRVISFVPLIGQLAGAG